jgi:long-chain fatty acid transport protein
MAMSASIALMGNGFRLPDQDAKATARGEAFAATADNASAIYYNPGGIGLLPGHNVRAGVFGIKLNVDYDSPVGTSSETDNSLVPVPNLFYSYGAEELPFAAGLGVYSPYGLKNEWPEDTGFRSIALKSELKALTVNPVVAWKILPNLSIGAGPTITYSEIELIKGVTPYPNNDYADLDGHTTDVGFNVGLIWQPDPKLSFGLSYRSKTDMGYKGTTTLDFVVPPPGYPQSLTMDNEATLVFPQNIVFGISYRPTPAWNIEFDIDWTDWNQLNTVYIDQAIPDSLKLDWESSFYYELGLTRYFGDTWVSAGYIYNENSVPTKTFNPWVSDQNRQFGCVGIGHKWRSLSFDLAYQFGFGPSRTVTGSPISNVGQSADGKYEYKSHAFAVSAGINF